MTKIVLSAAILFLATATVWGAGDSIINQQSLITSLGSDMTVSGPGGVGSTIVGPIVVNLAQEAAANDGQTTANQGITGIFSQSNITNPGLSEEQKLTANGLPIASGVGQAAGDQTEPLHGSVAWQIGSWVSMPQPLSAFSVSVLPALLVLPQ
jgi:hypothetical protein